MKRVIFLLVAVLLVLSACAFKKPSETESKLSLHLLDNSISMTDNPNLCIIPNEEIEEMIFPDMYFLGDNLLFFGTVYNEVHDYPISDEEGYDETMSDDDVFETCTAQLKLISIEDGSLIAEKEYPYMNFPAVQVSSDRVALHDIHSGSVYILDEHLESVSEYHFEGSDSAGLILDKDFQTAYIFDYFTNLSRLDLISGEKEDIIEAYGVCLVNQTDDKVFFYYTDRYTQCCEYRYLDLGTNTINPLPADIPSDSCDQYDSAWLFKNKHDYYEYELLSDGDIYIISSSDCSVTLSDNGHLVLRNDTCTEISLHELDGDFVSSFSFEQEYEHSIFPDNFLWSELYGGYFFTDTIDLYAALVFLDPEMEVSGSDLIFDEKVEEQISQEIFSPELYERAAEIGEKYDLDIRIGDMCEFDYEEQYLPTEMLTSEFDAEYALDVLDETLERYPVGFFTQLKYEDLEEIRIELVGAIPNAGGFAQNKGDYYLIAIDCNMIDSYVIAHEFSHVIDRRLDWDATLREDAIYSEEEWLTLQPDGFDYVYSYDVPYEIEEDYFFSPYFIMTYAITYPTEDRATLMGAAMDVYYHDYFEDNEPLHEKFDYYSRCIRDCFDTEGWPEVTEWEEIL